MVTCNEPTANFPSGLALLSAYDSNGDGFISKDDATRAVDDYRANIITQEEAIFVNDVYLYERPITEICPVSSMATPLIGIGVVTAAYLLSKTMKKKKGR